MIIAAIDVGYGNIKVVSYNTITNNMKMLLIPSIAGKADDSDISQSFGKKKNVYIVEYEGESYEIGEESIGNLVKVTHGEYLKTKSWKLFLLAALKSIGEETIDLVVSGLPVYQYKDLKEDMIQEIKGVHKVDKNLTVNIKNVEVIPQPLGALASLIDDKPELQSKNILLIDPGHHTFDWLCVVKGSIRMDLSGSHAEGVDSLINAVIKRVSKNNNGLMLSHHDIDEAIRNGTFKVEVYGKEFDIKQYLDLAVSNQLESSIDALKNMLQTTHNIGNILIGGGGANLYLQTIKESFPNHNVETMSEPAMANAKGYLRFGLAKAKNL